MTSLRINNKDFVAEEIGRQKSNAFVKFILTPSSGHDDLTLLHSHFNSHVLILKGFLSSSHHNMIICRQRGGRCWILYRLSWQFWWSFGRAIVWCFLELGMHPLTAASRSRLLETEPKLFVLCVHVDDIVLNLSLRKLSKREHSIERYCIELLDSRQKTWIKAICLDGIVRIELACCFFRCTRSLYPFIATHVLLSFVFFYEKQAIRRRQFAAIDCDVFMCGSYRIAGSELPRGLGAYVRVLY